MSSKKCCACKVVKLASEFWKDKSRPDGLNGKCKPSERARKKTYMKKYTAEYYQKNKAKINEQRKARYKSNPQCRIAENCRSRIRNLLNEISKSRSTLELVGLDSWDELVQHLESQFVDGMTWDNYGQWHMDHIRPCASFDLTDETQRLECFNYKNLQPLWAFDNLSKGDKFI